ncbi:MAG TPA: hypothetical protein VNQ73_17015 [Ilumatobacter sp.]|nr:hypothetical protein [Ilumatobacter sp.]
MVGTATIYMGSGGALLHGTVAEFDRAAGTGTVTADDGAQYPFHCIEIADGSRTIEPTTPVEFSLLAKFGRYQAAQIRPA